MKNGKIGSNLPYLQGGPPRALRVYLGVEAVCSVIVCCFAVIGSVILLFRGAWTYIFTGAMSVFSAVLSVNVFKGTNKILRGDCTGAPETESALRNRRILMWVMMGLSGFTSIISALSSRYASSASFFGVLLGVGLMALLILPIVFYYKNIERIMGYYVYREVSSGEISDSSGREGHLSAFCITFAALLLVLMTALQFRWDLISYRYYEFYDYLSLISLLLYLSAGRYLLVNICYRGFLRTHSDRFREENGVSAASGYNASSALSVIGSMLFGWRALNSLFTFINNLRYLSYGGNAFGVFRLLFECGCYVLLALALTRRNRRTVLPVIGSAVMVVLSVISIFRGGVSFSSLYNSAISVSNCLQIVLWAAIGFACVIRMTGETVPVWLRIFQIVLAGLQVMPRMIATLSDRMYRVPDLIYYLINNPLLVVALLALILWKTEKSESQPGNMPSGKETLQEAVEEN